MADRFTVGVGNGPKAGWFFVLDADVPDRFLAFSHGQAHSVAHRYADDMNKGRENPEEWFWFSVAGWAGPRG